jgi:hypothetical protein
MVATKDGFVEVYENVGVTLTPDKDGFVEVYENVGVLLGASSRSGYVEVYEGDVNSLQPVPHVWFVRPVEADVGEVVQIYGQGFGATAAENNGKAFLHQQPGWNGMSAIDPSKQLTPTGWTRVAASGNAYNGSRSINPVTGEPTMEHERIDTAVPATGRTGLVRVQTDDL